MSKINEAAAAALAGVKLAEARCNALAFAFEGIRGRSEWSTDADTTKEFNALWNALHRERIAAYERLFMWALFNDETRHKAAELALARFLSNKSSVIGYLYPDGAIPGRWASSEEDAFRTELNDLSTKLVNKAITNRKKK